MNSEEELERYRTIGRLVAFKTDVDCIVYSKENPESGWAMIIPKEDINSFKTTQTKGEVVILQSIRFTDEKNGWAAGKLETGGIVTGVIFHTENGGQNC